MPQPIQVISKPLVRAAEGELVPGDRVRVEFRRLQTLIVRAQRPAEDGGGVDDDDGGAAEIRVDVDERVEPDVEAAFFARLADGGVGERLAAIDICLLYTSPSPRDS